MISVAMDDDIDDLLNEIEKEYCATGSCSKYPRSTTKSDQTSVRETSKWVVKVYCDCKFIIASWCSLVYFDWCITFSFRTKCSQAEMELDTLIDEICNDDEFTIKVYLNFLMHTITSHFEKYPTTSKRLSWNYILVLCYVVILYSRSRNVVKLRTRQLEQPGHRNLWTVPSKLETRGL